MRASMRVLFFALFIIAAFAVPNGQFHISLHIGNNLHAKAISRSAKNALLQYKNKVGSIGGPVFHQDSSEYALELIKKVSDTGLFETGRQGPSLKKSLPHVSTEIDIRALNGDISSLSRNQFSAWQNTTDYTARLLFFICPGCGRTIASQRLPKANLDEEKFFGTDKTPVSRNRDIHSTVFANRETFGARSYDRFFKPKQGLSRTLDSHNSPDIGTRSLTVKSFTYNAFVSNVFGGKILAVEKSSRSPVKQVVLDDTERDGLTLDPCETVNDCQGNRLCISASAGLCNGQSDCVCAPPVPIQCTSSDVCPEGEVCAQVGGVGQFCVSEDVVEGDSDGDPASSPDGPSSDGDGLTLDLCTTDADCKGDRSCLSSATEACTGQSECRCVPPIPISCTSSDVCPEGEVCAQIGNPGQFCISEQVADAIETPQPPAATENPSVPPPTVVPSDPPAGGGLTLDPCSTNDDCKGDRQCLLTTTEVCAGQSTCRCVPLNPIQCTSSTECPTGEVCATVGDAGNFCVSEEQVSPGAPDPSPTEEPLPSSTPDGDGGLTLDICRTQAECKGDRQCVSVEGSLCSLSSEECRCVPVEALPCDTDTDCPFGEVCVNFGADTGFICVSEQVAPGPEETTVDPSDPPSGGLTLDPCESTSDCRGDRLCISTDGGICSGSGVCSCIPVVPIVCDSTTICPAGETCATVEGAGNFCVSEDVAESLPVPSDGPLEPSSDPGSGGLTGDQCTSNDDCKGDRKCIDGNQQECTGDVCFCFPPVPIVCESDANCPPGEVCVSFDNLPDICVSKDLADQLPPPNSGSADESPSAPPTSTPVLPDSDSVPPPSPSPSPSAVCIDASALEHIEQRDLVFAEHVLAKVLCDENNSCATAGHIVLFEGNAMMMRSYCEYSGCVQKEMLVNSPRYKVRMRVPSKTEGLEFTAFAARYETKVEEVFLRTAVHAGL